MKASYINPEIKLIQLDNEISLQLSSSANPNEEPDDWTLSHGEPMMMGEEFIV